MFRETNARCAGQVQHLQNVSLAVELRRRAFAIMVVHDAGMVAGDISVAYRNGAFDVAKLVVEWIDELAPAGVRCDNPPVE